MRGMDVRMIWQRDQTSGTLWLIDAWDEDSILENPDGWEAALSTAMEGDVEVRVVIAEVNLDAIEQAFQPPRTNLRHLRNGDHGSPSKDKVAEADDR